MKTDVWTEATGPEPGIGFNDDGQGLTSGQSIPRPRTGRSTPLDMDKAPEVRHSSPFFPQCYRSVVVVVLVLHPSTSRARPVAPVSIRFLCIAACWSFPSVDIPPSETGGLDGPVIRCRRCSSGPVAVGESSLLQDSSEDVERSGRHVR